MNKDLNFLLQFKGQTDNILFSFLQFSEATISILDAEGHYLYVNHLVPGFKPGIQPGIQKEEIIGQPVDNFMPDDLSKQLKAYLNRVINSGESVTYQNDISGTDGISRHYNHTMSPVKTNAGNTQAIIIFSTEIKTLQDIDENTKVSQQLAFQEEVFRKTFENAPNGIAMVDLNGKWFKMNKSFCDILGYPEEELLALSFLDITHPEEKKDDGVLFKEMVAGKQVSFQTEKRYTHKNGSTVWATLSVAAVKNDAGQTIHFVYQINDITQKKQVQIQLQEHINRLQGLLDASTQVGIIETDANGIIQIFNKGAENLLGYTADEVVDTYTPEIFHKKEELIQCNDELPAKNNNTSEPFWVTSKHLKKNLFQPREWTYIRKNNSSFRGLLSLTPIRNAQQEIAGLLLLITDLTLIKKAEREIKSLLDVTQAQNKRLLNFAHIVSHNLRSHTANITMILSMMQSEDAETIHTQYLPLLQKSSENLKETISHLNEVVAMNTNADVDLSALNLYQYVEKTIEDVKALAMDADCTIHNKVHQKLMVKALPAYLESIILNMLTNGIKYRSPKRKSTIHITSKLHKNYVLLMVQDNGLGMDLKLHGAKVFGMYKTFHGNKDARGIGLFITKNQAEAMGGHIEVESTVNQGTTFKIYFLHEKV